MSLTAAGVMGLVSLATSLAATGVGAGMSANANRKNKSILDDQNSMLEKEYYRGILDDPASQSYLRTLRDNIGRKMGGIENSAIATGATHENTLAAKDTANRSVTEAVGGLLQNKESRKMGYMNGLLNAMGKKMDINSAEAAGWSKLAADIASASGDLAESYIDNDAKLFEKKKAPDAVSTDMSE